MKLSLALLALSVTPLHAGSSLSYGGDAEFLRRHTKVIELQSGDAALLIAPEYQGRVMTSTASGDGGTSFGWLNYKLIKQGILPPEKAAGKLESHIYVFGGEERFWLGPEGGQFGIFFPPGAKFDFAQWKTPPALDTEPFEVVATSPSQASFLKEFRVTNHSGETFPVKAERTVRLLSDKEIRSLLGVPLPEGVRAVAYETINRITNRGDKAWTPETGLLSIWILGMYKPSPSTVLAIPFRKGDEKTLGPVVNDAYFGKIPPDRLKISDGVVYFKGDGGQRGKIGIPPKRSLGVAGSYSADQGSLNLVFTTRKAKGLYVNSMWEKQKDPYCGDAINAYNDGSPAPGDPPLGPFYELETSSPGAQLKPGQSLEHRQTTVHLLGDEASLDPIARKHLNTGITAIRTAFKK
jgi:hypothetical protein